MGTTDERQSGAASTNLSEIMTAVAASADRVLIIHGRKECSTDVPPVCIQMWLLERQRREDDSHYFLWFPLFQVAFWCISEKEATAVKDIK